MLQAASNYVGSPVTGEDLLEALKRLRAACGQRDPDFADPQILAAFKRNLRAAVAQRKSTAQRAAKHFQ
jgi:hypothetical protein